MTNLKKAARQALEALESYSKSDYIKKQHPKRRANGEKAITALREALAEPQIKSDNYLNGYCTGRTDLLAEQAEQEPVAWMAKNGEVCRHGWRKFHAREEDVDRFRTPLYAAPVRTKDLTDDEIAQAVGSPLDEVYLADFRAVIAADREKNK